MSMFTITIDRGLCSGFGACVALAPDIVRLDSGGVAETRVGETDDPSVLEAAASCPMAAIRVEEAA